MSSFIDALKAEWEKKEKMGLTLKKAKIEYSNDNDLATFFIANYPYLLDFNEFEAARIVKEFPDQTELGKYLRNQ